MAENGMNGHQTTAVTWKVGLMNAKGKYFTAESFGYKVNASGPALKKKQIWTIEQDAEDDSVYIRSCQDRYLTSDKYGTVKVDIEEENKGTDEKFLVEYSEDGNWAFKHVTFGNYLKGLDEDAKCFDKRAGPENWWRIQLYTHPQIHLRNVNRKRYVHLNRDTNELECTEPIPWGSDALVLLDFEEGKYTLKSCDNKYLSCDGTLEEEVSDRTKYNIEVHSRSITFKDCNGRYLTGVGKGTMKGKNKTVSKDELFIIEESHPQCQIISPNGKSVSIKQGQEVSANQPTDEISDFEIFQMEHDKVSDKWAFRASTGKYWCFQDDGTVLAKQAEATKNCYFKLEWQEDGTAGIECPNGKYLSNRQTGVLYSTSDMNKFTFVIVNRPILILKSEFGYVGTNPKETHYICNKTKYDVVKIEYVGEASYTIKDQKDRNWYVGDDNMVYLDESRSSKFKFQFCGNSMLAIRAPNGCYLKGEQNGLFKATAEEISATSMWEF